MKRPILQILLLSSASIALGLGLSACSKSLKTTPVMSPFGSTVPGVSIPNAHLVTQEAGFAMRGMTPQNAAQISELKQAGITDILIFRNDVKGEASVANELKLLEEARYSSDSIHQVPFAWKNFKNFREPCLQTLKALRLIRASVRTSGKGIYFHCTVGEDRTGYLTAFYKILYEKKDIDKAFREDMCARGYAEGDPLKPNFVVDLVHKSITEHFIKMNYLVSEGKLDGKNLGDGVCELDPDREPEFRNKMQRELVRFRCGTSL